MVTMTIVLTMNTGTIIVGMMAIGFMHHMATIVAISLGGTRGGGIGIGGAAVGSIIGLGISSMPGTTLFGTIMDAGGIGRAMDAMCDIACLIVIILSEQERGHMASIFLISHRARSMYRTGRIKSGSLLDREILNYLPGWRKSTAAVT
jgi:hypothetical protein